MAGPTEKAPGVVAARGAGGGGSVPMDMAAGVSAAPRRRRRRQAARGRRRRGRRGRRGRGRRARSLQALDQHGLRAADGQARGAALLLELRHLERREPARAAAGLPLPLRFFLAATSMLRAARTWVAGRTKALAAVTSASSSARRLQAMLAQPYLSQGCVRNASRSAAARRTSQMQLSASNAVARKR